VSTIVTLPLDLADGLGGDASGYRAVGFDLATIAGAGILADAALSTKSNWSNRSLGVAAALLGVGVLGGIANTMYELTG
jgi:hypothetical protein